MSGVSGERTVAHRASLSLGGALYSVVNVTYRDRVRDPALWRNAFSARLRWAVLALITFPLGHWVFDKLFPQATIGSLIAAILFLIVALAWVIWETRRGQ